MYKIVKKSTYRETLFLVKDLNELKKIDRLKDKTIVEIYNLQTLYLNDNEIKEIPPEIGSLTNLQILYFSYNKIKEIPSEIGFLTNLQYLSLNNNEINESSKKIIKSVNIRNLYLKL